MSIWWLIGIVIGALWLIGMALVLGLCRAAGVSDELSEEWKYEINKKER